MLTNEQRQTIIAALQHGEELSPEWAHFLFPPERREYELTYYGKERAEDIIADAMSLPLQPMRTFGSSSPESDWQNMLIFGDNLQVIKKLIELKEKGELRNADGTPGVRVIYIDPPFASKQDFKGSEEQKAYQDRVAGAKFLEFLRKRLVLLRELLTDDGSIFVHLDWKKGHYVKVIMDEVFGENNFLNEIVWYYRRWNIAGNFFARNHDSILYYAKNRGQHIFENLFIPKSPKSSSQDTAWVSVMVDGQRKSKPSGKPTKGVPMPDVWAFGEEYQMGASPFLRRSIAAGRRSEVRAA